LLVEDHAGEAHRLRKTLVQAGATQFKIVHVRRLSRALKRLAKGDIDVVLLELSLPDGPGVDAVTRMHAAAPGVPIVVLTALDDEELALMAVGQGAQDYLVKGQVDSPVLVRAIRYAIARQRAEEGIRGRVLHLEVLNRLLIRKSVGLRLS
jgi:DNA-binding NarL/FixJ family response regulator